MLAVHLPKTRYLRGDNGHDADHWHDWLMGLHIQPVPPNRSNRKGPHAFDARRSKTRNLIKGMFGRLKNFRCVATRYGKTCNISSHQSSAHLTVQIRKMPQRFKRKSCTVINLQMLFATDLRQFFENTCFDCTGHSSFHSHFDK